MAHFAQIENGIVTNVIVISNDVVGEYPESESIGQQFISNHNYQGQWIQTSYNGNFRKQYGMVGYGYDVNANEFVAPSPFPSWSLDANNDWQAPTPKPEGDYMWDEETLAWVAAPVG